jgi:hypothetical protein
MFRKGRYVKVLRTGLTGRIEECSSVNDKYFVVFYRDISTGQWNTGSELEGVSTALYFLRLHSQKIFQVAVRLVAFLPERFWYSTVLRISVLQALIMRPLIALSPYRKDLRRRVITAWFLNSWLRQLGQLGRPFAIPIRIEGDESILDGSLHPNGLVICSAHLPLIHLILSALVTIDRAPTEVVASEQEMNDGRIRVWGLNKELLGIVANWSELLRMKRVLSRGGSVFALLDTHLGQFPRPNILRLIQKVHSRAVFAMVELMPNGEIHVEFSAPPDPLCSSDQSILMNLQVLQRRIDRVLRHSSSDQKSQSVTKTMSEPSIGVGSKLDTSC